MFPGKHTHYRLSCSAPPKVHFRPNESWSLFRIKDIVMAGYGGSELKISVLKVAHKLCYTGRDRMLNICRQNEVHSNSKITG